MGSCQGKSGPNAGRRVARDSLARIAAEMTRACICICASERERERWRARAPEKERVGVVIDIIFK